MVVINYLNLLSEFDIVKSDVKNVSFKISEFIRYSLIGTPNYDSG
jgi:hypothetical protein